MSVRPSVSHVPQQQLCSRLDHVLRIGTNAVPSLPAQIGMYPSPTNVDSKLVPVKTEAVKLYFEVAHANAPLAPLHERIMNLGGFSYTGEPISNIAQKDVRTKSIQTGLLIWLFDYYKGFLEEVKGAMLHTRASYSHPNHSAYHADEGWDAYVKKRDGSTTSKARLLLSDKKLNREKDKRQILAFFDDVNKKILHIFNPSGPHWRLTRGNVGIARELYRDYAPQLTALIESTKQESEAAKSLVNMVQGSSSNPS